MEGIRSYGRYYSIELDEYFTIQIDLNKKNRNEYVIMNLINTGGSINPLECSLIYSNKGTTKSELGNKIRLNSYKCYIVNGDKLRIINADESEDIFEYDSSTQKYINKEKHLTATVVKDMYSSITEVAIQSKDKTEMDIKKGNNYPTLIQKGQRETRFVLSGTKIASISNQVKDVIEFSHGGTNTTITWKKNGYINRKVDLTYDASKNLTGIKIKNKNDQLIGNYSLELSSGLIKIENNVSYKSIKVTVGSNYTEVEKGYQEGYQEEENVTITYNGSATNVKSSIGPEMKYIYGQDDKIVCEVSSSNIVNIYKYRDHKLLKKVNPLSTLESSDSIMRNGYFNNGFSNWTMSSNVSLATCGSEFGFNVKCVTLKMNQSIEQTINYEGSSLDRFTLSYFHGQSSVGGYYSIEIGIITLDKNGVKIEELKENNTDYFAIIGYGYGATSFTPTKSFSKIKIKITCIGNWANVGRFNLLKRSSVEEYLYNDQDELYAIKKNNQTSRINTNDDGKIVSGNINESYFNKEISGNTETILGDFGVKTVIAKDNYEREISRTTTSGNDKFIEKKTYSGDELIEESDGVRTVKYTYTNDEKLPLSITFNNRKISYTYNERSLINKIVDGNLNVTYTYTENDELFKYSNYENSYENEQLKTIKLNNDLIEGYEYSQDRLTKKNYKDSNVTYSYDLGKLKTINVNNHKTITYNYDNNDRVISIDDVEESITNKTEYLYDVYNNVKEEKVTFNVGGEERFSSEENYFDNDSNLLSQVSYVNKKYLLKSYDLSDKSVGKSYTLFKETMYRYPSLLLNGNTSYETYCCFFDRSEERLINIEPREKDKEITRTISPQKVLDIKSGGKPFRVLLDAGYGKSLEYNLPSYDRQGKIDFQIMFEMRKYSNYDSGTIMYIGPKNSKRGSLMVKCISQSDGSYLGLYANGGSDYLIEQLKIKIEDDGWNKVGIYLKQFTGANYICDIIFCVNGQTKTLYQAKFAQRFEILGSNAHLFFGGVKVNSTISEPLFSSLSSIMLTMNKNEPAGYYEKTLESLQGLQEEYQVYEEPIEGNAYKQTGTETYNLASRNINHIYPLNGSFNSLTNQNPIYFDPKEEQVKDSYFIYNKDTKRYEYYANGSVVRYKLTGSAGTISVNAKIKNNKKIQTILSIKTNNTIIDLIYENGKYKYRRNVSVDKDGNNVYATTNISDITEGEHRFTISYVPSGTITTFRIFLDKTLKKTFTIDGLMISTMELTLGLDQEELYPLLCSMNHLVTLSYSIGTSTTEIYNLLKSIKIKHLFDKYGRLSDEKLEDQDGSEIYSRRLSYCFLNGYNTNDLRSCTINLNGKNDTFGYDYLNSSNVYTHLVQKVNSTITKDNTTTNTETKYTYDDNDRLKSEKTGTVEKKYIYDQYGNLTSKDGIALNYDNIYRLTSYGNKKLIYLTENKYKLLGYGTFDSMGTQLTGLRFAYKGNKISGIKIVETRTVYNFKYDHQGRRIKKGDIDYVYLSNHLAAEIHTDYTLRFLYDENNNLYGFYYNDEPYFYLKDGLGIIYAVVDKNKTKVVSYKYDAWGKLLDSSVLNTGIGKINPFIYKSYYYDKEISLYWLTTRFYDPDIGRFLTLDSASYLDAQSPNSLNLFAYCNNNPVMYADPSGHFVITIGMLITGMAFGAAIGAGIGFGTAVYNDYKDDGEIFNGSIAWKTYVGGTIGGFIAGAGLGAASVFGAAAGTAALVGSSATLFTSTGLSLTFGSAMALGTGSAFVTGMVGYSARALIDPTEQYSFGNMVKEGVFNAISGALNVAGGYLVGITGFRADYVSKLLARTSDLFIRPIVQNYFTFMIKIGLALIKSNI